MQMHRITRQLEESAQYPDVCCLEGASYAAYQVCRDGKDDIEVRRLDGSANPVVFHSRARGQCYLPRLMGADKKLFLAYTEAMPEGNWRLRLAVLEAGVWCPPRTVDEGECLFRPEMAWYESCLWLFYTQLGPVPQAVARYIDHGKVSRRLHLLPKGETYRPVGAVGPDGYLYVGFDRFNGTNYDMWCGVWENGRFLVRCLSDEPAFATSCAAVPAQDGVSLLWSEVREGSQQNYSDATVAFVHGALIVREQEVNLRGNTWVLYQGADASGRYAVFNNSRQIVLRRKLERGWDALCMVAPADITCFQRRPRCAQGEDGTIHIVFQKAKGNGHTWTRNAEIIYTRLTPEEYDRNKDPGLSGVVEPFSAPVQLRNTAPMPSAEEIRRFVDSGLESYQGLYPYWGDIHGQSRMSDGLGEVDQYYNYAKGVAKGDFAALTDHDCFPDVLTPAEVALIQAHCEHFNTPHLATLHAYEWTSNEFRYDYGHKNVYFRASGPYCPCTSREGYSPERLYAALRPHQALVVPHHIGAVWAVVLASTDWAYHHPELQCACEVLSRHAVFETDHDVCPYTKNVDREEGNSIHAVLAHGYRTGFLGGSDSHQLEAGTEGGMTCVFATELARGDVFDAIRARRTVATTGARILAQFEIAGQAAGSEVRIKAGQAVQLRAHILAPEEIDTVQLVRNGEVAFTYSACGNSLEIDKNIFCDESCWYYLRIALKDGHLALVSPIWLDADHTQRTEEEILCSSRN